MRSGFSCRWTAGASQAGLMGSAACWDGLGAGRRATGARVWRTVGEGVAEGPEEDGADGWREDVLEQDVLRVPHGDGADFKEGASGVHEEAHRAALARRLPERAEGGV